MAPASTVAVVVPSPATSSVFFATSLTSSAPTFSHGSSRSISLAIETPSLVIVGAPHFFSSTTLRPFGPSVTFTASTSWFMPLSSARRACSSNAISFGISVGPPFAPGTSDRALALSSIECQVSTHRVGVLPPDSSPGQPAGYGWLESCPPIGGNDRQPPKVRRRDRGPCHRRRADGGRASLAGSFSSSQSPPASRSPTTTTPNLCSLRSGHLPHRRKRGGAHRDRCAGRVCGWAAVTPASRRPARAPAPRRRDEPLVRGRPPRRRCAPRLCRSCSRRPRSSAARRSSRRYS